MKCNRQNFLSFWIFCSFTPLTTKKITILKYWKKKHLEILSFHMCTINNNQKMYGSWDIECDGQNFLSFWTIFAHLPPKNPKNQNFEKMKKMPGDIIILHKCTKNHDHMLQCSWDMACDRCNYFPFWAIFCPFTIQKIKISKKWKNTWIYHHFIHV